MAENRKGSKRLVPTILPDVPIVDSPVPGSDPHPGGTSIIYGDLFGELVLIPRARANELIAVRNAVKVSRTWGELLDRLAACSQEAHEYVATIVSDSEIANEDMFNSREIGAIADGDWPPWPQQEMLAWVPDDIRERFGRIGLTTLNGEYLSFSDYPAAQVIAAFEADGFVVTHDEDAVAVASGW